MENLDYLDVNNACIWPINNFTSFVIDTIRNQWRIYEYNNLLVDKGPLDHHSSLIAGIFPKDKEIYI